MRAAIRAEWTKLTTVPDLAVTLLLSIALTTAVSVAAAALTDDITDGVRLSLIGIQVGQAVVAVAGVQILAGEYGNGLIRAGLLAFPRRLPILAAKALLLLAGTAVAALVSVAASLVAGIAWIDNYPIGEVLLRPAFGSFLYLCLIALLGLGTAAIVRSATAAAGIVLALLFVLPSLLPLLPDPDWIETLYKLTPSTAGLTIQSAYDLDAVPIGPWAGLGVAALWSFGALTLGALFLARRDHG